jgi:hypothetical protein
MSPADAAASIRLLLNDFARAYALRDCHGLQSLMCTERTDMIAPAGLCPASALVERARLDWSRFEASAIVFSEMQIALIGCIAQIIGRCHLHARVGPDSFVQPFVFDARINCDRDRCLMTHVRFEPVIRPDRVPKPAPN